MFWKIKEDKPVVKKIHLADRYSISQIKDGINRLLQIQLALPTDRGGYRLDYLDGRTGIMNIELTTDLMLVLQHLGCFRREGDYYIPKSG